MNRIIPAHATLLGAALLLAACGGSGGRQGQALGSAVSPTPGPSGAVTPTPAVSPSPGPSGAPGVSPTPGASPGVTPSPTPAIGRRVGERFDPEPGPADLLPLELESQLRGCDPVDGTHCLHPFPNNHFTSAAPGGSPQAEQGTGLRVDLPLAGMPRNIAGKPIDPTEWNRNDGFSPGALLLTYVPGLDLERSGAVPLTDIARSFDAEAPIMVVDAQTGERQLIWTELDTNAGELMPASAACGAPGVDRIPDAEENCPLPDMVANPRPAQPALLIRPARNFRDGRRYLVLLRELLDSEGQQIPAPPGFVACRDGADLSTYPALAARCAELEQNVFANLPPDVARQELHLAWDFTVASGWSNVGRLRHMRDVAFAQLGETRNPDNTVAELGDAPSFSVSSQAPQDEREAGMFRRVEGTLEVPSFLIPADPLGRNPAVQAVLEAMEAAFPEEFSALFEGTTLASGLSTPPNRLFYDPSDGDPAVAAADPLLALYGDGLPDLVQQVQNVPFICQIPDTANGATTRAGVYGHGLLDSRAAVGYDRVPEMSREHDFMFCTIDWFGFASGDLANVASTLVDLSQFPVVPDASQQGMLNFLFLARALRHPDGFGSHPAFQDENGQPLFRNEDIFYDGNSQGGILGGVVAGLSHDIERGVLGALGMNYSLLLRRSTGFTLYSVPLYFAYQDDLDRNICFSLIQMIWDRSENNGYANHLVEGPELAGSHAQLLLHPSYGDFQVTHWSAEVMARSLSPQLAGDPRQVQRVEQTLIELGQQEPDYVRHLDAEPMYAIPPLDYADPVQAAGSAIIMYDDIRTQQPPTVNKAPSAADGARDPHDDPAFKRDGYGRCQKSHFLHPQGRLIDVIELHDFADPDNGETVPCPPLPAF